MKGNVFYFIQLRTSAARNLSQRIGKAMLIYYYNIIVTLYTKRTGCSNSIIVLSVNAKWRCSFVLYCPHTLVVCETLRLALLHRNQHSPYWSVLAWYSSHVSVVFPDSLLTCEFRYKTATRDAFICVSNIIGASSCEIVRSWNILTWRDNKT